MGILNKILSRDEILTAPDLPMERVEVPEWGGSVYVRTMTGAERDAWEVNDVKRRKETGDSGNIRAMLAALTLCDQSGKLLFSLADVETLGGKSAAGLDRVVDVALKLNRITQSDFEDLEKN